MFSAKILADTRGTHSRLTTFELTYPRCIHSEFMTHRMFSRNAASSRAIPIEKTIAAVRDNPFVPIEWGKNQSGMQAREVFTGGDAMKCAANWKSATFDAVRNAERLNALGLHKQIVNRVLEPFTWITVIATGIDKAWENFFALRCHPDAEPHIHYIADRAAELFDASTPPERLIHLPLAGEGFPDEDLTFDDLPKVSTARCARVSYLTHDGRRDVSADIALHDRLVTSGHWSPFEHVAFIDDTGDGKGGNFGPGWIQYRKTFPGELQRRKPKTVGA